MDLCTGGVPAGSSCIHRHVLAVLRALMLLRAVSLAGFVPSHNPAKPCAHALCPCWSCCEISAHAMLQGPAECCPAPAAGQAAASEVPQAR